MGTPPIDLLKTVSGASDLESLATAIAQQVAHAIALEQLPPPLLDLKGAARRLNVSTSTVESLVAMGELSVIRIGTGRGVRRFDHSSLEALIRRRARSL